MSYHSVLKTLREALGRIEPTQQGGTEAARCLCGATAFLIIDEYATELKKGKSERELLWSQFAEPLIKHFSVTVTVEGKPELFAYPCSAELCPDSDEFLRCRDILREYRDPLPALATLTVQVAADVERQLEAESQGDTEEPPIGKEVWTETGSKTDSVRETEC